MRNKREFTAVFRLAALLLAVILVVPTGAKAATAPTVEPYASDHLSSYRAHISPGANGKIQVHFSVMGKYEMDSIGALDITVFHSIDNVNWIQYKYYSHDDYPSLLNYNTNYHSGYIECQGGIGMYYQAKVTIWGGNGSDGTMRYLWTSVKQAVQSPS